MGRERTVVLIVLAILFCSPFMAGLTAQNSRPTAQSGDAARGRTGKAEAAPNAHMSFRDVASEVGVTTMPNSQTDRRYVLETVGGGGIALFDCDNEGRLTSKMTQIDEVRGGGSYNSTNDTRLHFGLGSEATINKLEVLWPSGLRQEFSEIQADAIYEI